MEYQDEPRQFALGVNYWPADKAMYWWQDFDVAEVEADFGRMAASGLRTARVFLLWEDFQPSPSKISSDALRHLVCLADIADKLRRFDHAHLFLRTHERCQLAARLDVGVLAEERGVFRSGRRGRQLAADIRNWFSDREVICRPAVAVPRGGPCSGRSSVRSGRMTWATNLPTV